MKKTSKAVDSLSRRLFNISETHSARLVNGPAAKGYVLGALVLEAAYQVALFAGGERPGPYWEWYGGAFLTGADGGSRTANPDMVTEGGRAVAAYESAETFVIGLVRRTEGEVPGMEPLSCAVQRFVHGERSVPGEPAGEEHELLDALKRKPEIWENLVRAVGDHRGRSGKAPSLIPREVLPQNRGKRSTKRLRAPLAALDRTAPQVPEIIDATWLLVVHLKLARKGDRNARAWKAGFDRWFDAW
jgi:hypothetical protein